MKLLNRDKFSSYRFGELNAPRETQGETQQVIGREGETATLFG